jgi:hypothetical protein
MEYQLVMAKIFAPLFHQLLDTCFPLLSAKVVLKMRLAVGTPNAVACVFAPCLKFNVEVNLGAQPRLSGVIACGAEHHVFF